MSSRPSCLIVASNFPPVQSAGVYRTLRIAKYLPDLDWDLSVLTLSASTLPKGTVVDEALLKQVPETVLVERANASYPLEYMNSIRRLTKRKVASRDGAKNPKPTSAGNRSTSHADRPVGRWQSLKDRMTMPFMTPDRLVGWVRSATRVGSRVARERNIDLIYSSGPPFSNHLVGGAIKSKTGKPWVADFRDPWLGNKWRPSREGDTWSGKQHRLMESEVFRSADRIIFNTELSRRDAINRSGELLEGKSVVIPNGFDPANFAFDSGSQVDPSPGRSSQGGCMPLTIVHTGSFYGRRNVDSLIRVVGDLVVEGRLNVNDLRIDLIGNTRAHEKQLIEECGVGNMVCLVPPMPHRDCIGRLYDADILLLVQTEAPLCVPGKLYEYIAVGKPVLTLASSGATADMVTDEDLGPCVSPDDPNALKEIVLDLVKQHRDGRLQSPSGDAIARYDGRNQMKEFDRVFREAVSIRIDD